MNIYEYQSFIPNVKLDGMIFYTPNAQCVWRIETLYTKEPDTIEWLKSIPSDGVLFDVGANIGIYTVFAAKRGVKVVAFEPEAMNYMVLCKNIYLNNLDNVTAYCVALTDRFSIDRLRVTKPEPGLSCHQFYDDVDYKGNHKNYEHQQGCVGMRMDSFSIYPTHIKIDVDGFEHLVLEGGHLCLNKATSVLIETDINNLNHQRMMGVMRDLGFEYDEAQAKASRRKDGPFKDIGNVIWTKS